MTAVGIVVPDESPVEQVALQLISPLGVVTMPLPGPPKKHRNREGGVAAAAQHWRQAKKRKENTTMPPHVLLLTMNRLKKLIVPPPISCEDRTPSFLRLRCALAQIKKRQPNASLLGDDVPVMPRIE
jgi:hypothetical protein